MNTYLVDCTNIPFRILVTMVRSLSEEQYVFGYSETFDNTLVIFTNKSQIERLAERFNFTWRSI